MDLDYDISLFVLEVLQNHCLGPGFGIGAKPVLSGFEEATAPTSSLHFKFSGVGHSFHP